LPYTNIEAGMEYASPDFIDNDFDFSRYYISLRRTQQTLGMGITALYIYASTSDRTLPPQRYFMINFWKTILSTPLVFKTLKETNFCGDRTALAYLSHNFGRRLFKRSGLPLIKDIPFSLRLYGGVFWCDFEEPPSESHDDYILTATKPYSEAGFSLGQLPPVNLNLYFTWQLSDYNTSNFAFNIGFSF